ncbi:MAG: dihydroneopterin aldolase [Deltaproteobacteria bacterium]|nr:dihydroneopterin aldolase [Deltaproteobacteria bacterium]
MVTSGDLVQCRALRLRVRIGFHDYERHIEQAVRVDLSIWTDFRTGPGRDRADGLVDYYVLTARLQEHVAGKTYDMVEALAVDLARETVRLFPSVTVRVRVEKVPLDMPMVDSVAVECTRTAADFRDGDGG